MGNYKLYSRETGYKCKINLEELKFLFGYNGECNADAINIFLTNNETGYYIK